MRIKRETPEVNAGSMADIAFLLLIFFLVTTTIETDKGLNRTLPSSLEASPIAERNLFRVNLNLNNEIMVEDELLSIQNLREKAIAFLDNGGNQTSNAYCDYCLGDRDSKSSDNPQKAIIALANTRETNYGVYVAVQNELEGAYMQLRNRESLRLHGILYEDLLKTYNGQELSNIEKQKLKKQIETIRKLFPKNLSETEINTKKSTNDTTK